MSQVHDGPYEILVDDCMTDASAAALLASGKRAWIVRYPGGYGSPYGHAVLNYWEGEIGEGRPVALTFRNVTSAREFWHLNMNDGACAECFARARTTGSRHCIQCSDLLRKINDLERRYKAAKQDAEFASEAWKKLKDLEQRFKSSDFTKEDKAAVLDVLIQEIGAEKAKEEARGE